MIFAAYSASMISYVTAYVHNLPFRSIEEFVNDGTYDVILNKDSADYDMFAVSLSNNEEFSYDNAFTFTRTLRHYITNVM